MNVFADIRNDLQMGDGDGISILNRSLRILFLEDNADDVELMEYELREVGMQFVSMRVDNLSGFVEAITDFQPEVILADYSLPMFNGVQAFRIIKKRKMMTPFILVTGVLNEQLAAECLKEGISDFILKSSFKRLPSAILNAVKRKEVEDEKGRIAKELERSRHELRLLVNRHQVSIEEERLNIARDLHDELGQVLTALKIDIVMLMRKINSGKQWPDELVAEEFDSVCRTVDKISTSLHQISSGLRPAILDDMGIVETIRWQAVEFEERSKIKCNVVLPQQNLKLPNDLSIAIFRIVQEALTNIARHSHAQCAEITLQQRDDGLHVMIWDDGVGIDMNSMKSSKSLGLIGLRERVQLLSGTFSIDSSARKGTELSAVFPVHSLQEDIN